MVCLTVVLKLVFYAVVLASQCSVFLPNIEINAGMALPPAFVAEEKHCIRWLKLQRKTLVLMHRVCFFPRKAWNICTFPSAGKAPSKWKDKLKPRNGIFKVFTFKSRPWYRGKTKKSGPCLYKKEIIRVLSLPSYSRRLHFALAPVWDGRRWLWWSCHLFRPWSWSAQLLQSKKGWGQEKNDFFEKTWQ